MKSYDNYRGCEESYYECYTGCIAWEESCCEGCIGPRGCRCCECYIDQGPTGPTGPTGPIGPIGGFQLSSYLTAKSVQSDVAQNGMIIFGKSSSSNGNNIIHPTDTSTFTLAGGYTYFIEFSVNGVDQVGNHGLFFALMKNNFITDARVASQNVGGPPVYGSGSAYYFVTVPLNSPVTIQIVNIGIDPIALVNANISILQISN